MLGILWRAIARGLKLLLFLIALVLPFAAVAASPFTAIHPEEAYPDNIPPMVSPGPFTEFIKQVQEKLHEHGFDAGPINGDYGPKTQAALTQFQLSRVLPASGALDDRTLNELGVERAPQQSDSSASSYAQRSAAAGGSAPGPRD